MPVRQVARFAERFAVPVATTFRRSHLMDALHPCYAGDLGIGTNPKLLARVKAADVIVAVGARLGEVPSQGYTLFEIPNPRQTFVHVHPDAAELGRVYRPHLAINAAPTAFAAALGGLQPPNEIRWRAETDAAHADYMAWSEKPLPAPGTVNPGEIMVWLRENPAAGFTADQWRGQLQHLDASLITACVVMRRSSARSRARWAMARRRQSDSKRLYPDRTVIALAGDGDFLMNGQEFATAVQFDAPIIVLVCDNGIYGTIRMHQERDYPGRVSATTLKNPDFAAYARAFGGFGVTVEKTADFPAAFKAAQASGLPAIIHLKIDPEAITPTTTLREAA